MVNVPGSRWLLLITDSKGVASVSILETDYDGVVAMQSECIVNNLWCHVNVCVAKFFQKNL